MDSLLPLTARVVAERREKAPVPSHCGPREAAWPSCTRSIQVYPRRMLGMEFRNAYCSHKSGGDWRGVIERTFDVRVFRNDVRMFVTPGHFYSPIANPAECDRHIAKIDAAGVSDDLPGISLTRTDMIETWHALLPFLKSNPFTATRVAKYRYALTISSIRGETAAFYTPCCAAIVRTFIEIGCGWCIGLHA